jgi:hypothetical protein
MRGRNLRFSTRQLKQRKHVDLINGGSAETEQDRGGSDRMRSGA